MCAPIMKTDLQVPENLATLMRTPHLPQAAPNKKSPDPQSQEHLLCRAGLSVAQMGAQRRPAVWVTHAGVDLSLLVLETDSFGGDTT